MVELQRREEARARLRHAALTSTVTADPELRARLADEYAPLAWEPGPALFEPARPPPLLLHQLQSDIGRELDALAEKNAARWRAETLARHATTTPTAEDRTWPPCTPTSAKTRPPRAAAA